jgi:hypothetical protein
VEVAVEAGVQPTVVTVTVYVPAVVGNVILVEVPVAGETVVPAEAVHV